MIQLGFKYEFYCLKEAGVESGLEVMLICIACGIYFGDVLWVKFLRSRLRFRVS